MTGRRRQSHGRYALYLFTLMWFAVMLPLSAFAAPYAAMVVDARSGKVLHAENADTRLHPASLTKMMTLYIAFEAVQNGELSMDTYVTISKNAAAEPPSKLGLKQGQKIQLRYLVRAAAVKSANDAATAIGEAIEGSEAAFARRMNRTAKAMGMTRTTFRNAHGLTEEGHLSTARDMTILGRHVIYDYPMYYNLFSRQTADAGVRTVSHTNRRLLQSYRGADGIKTGYTSAAGFNLTASAERGSQRVVATVFGGRSTATRNARVAELLDLGFRRAPSRAPLRKPAPPVYASNPAAITDPGAAGKTIRVSGAVQKSLRPQLRPGAAEPVLVAEAVVQTAKAEEDTLRQEIAEAVAEVKTEIKPPETTAAAADTTVATVQPAALDKAIRPNARPANVPASIISANAAEELPDDTQREVVTRLSTSGGKHWGINVGRYTSRYQAEKVLLRTALAEMSSLDGSLRKVVKGPRGFDANFHGMTRDTADLACRRLQARNVSCFMIGPS